MGVIDPRIPMDVPEGWQHQHLAWRAGFIACLRDLDAGLFDRPLPAEVDAAADWGFTVENYYNGHEYVPGTWVVVDYEGNVCGAVMDTRREAEREAVARWRDDSR